MAVEGKSSHGIFNVAESSSKPQFPKTNYLPFYLSPQQPAAVAAPHTPSTSTGIAHSHPKAPVPPWKAALLETSQTLPRWRGWVSGVGVGGGALHRTHRPHSLTVRTYCSSRSKHLTYHFCSNRTNPNSRKKLLQHSAWEAPPLLPALTRLCFQPWRAPVAAKREAALFQPSPVSSFVPTRQEDLGEAGGDRLTVLTQSCCPFRTYHIFTPQALPSAPSLHPRDLPRPSLPRVSQLAKR